jgi:hypothetical protein
MRWVRSVVVVGAVFVALLTSVVGATANSPAFKTGTYNLKNLKPGGYTVTLRHEHCAGKLQFCVALPKSPNLACETPGYLPARVGDFATPVALPSSGKLTEHSPITAEEPAIEGGPLPTGQSTFSVAFQKNGTASGYVEVSLVVLVGTDSIPCSDKVSFTAKLA